MNTEDDEFRRIEAEALRRAAQDDDDTQAYTSETVAVKAYRLGYEAGVAAERKACAKLARKIGDATEPDDWALDKCQDIEAAIRARGML